MIQIVMYFLKYGKNVKLQIKIANLQEKLGRHVILLKKIYLWKLK